MRRNRKAQAAIEYLMVFGVALLLSTPFIVRAQESIIEIRTGSQMLEARNTLNEIQSAAETVNAAGEPARRTFSIRIPEAVENTSVEGRYVRMSINNSRSYVGMSRRFDFNVTGDIPDAEGNYLLAASAESGEVNFEVVS